MKEFQFKVNKSNGRSFILTVKSTDYIADREKVYKLCYKAGYCFLGRV
ncbi:MAG: hypothetical protein GX957_16450, partial [Clostridiaceae bacterium]|nr:hypothetical protein [Clostridiaceae bacterium]